MPEVSRFYGIVVQIFADDHPPPHFHVRCGGSKAKVAIKYLTILKGSLPPHATGPVMEWATLHQQELLAARNRAQRHEAPGKIGPLD